MEFYTHDTDALIKQFSSNVQDGLDENTIHSARKKFGKNILKVANTRNIFQNLLGQFTSPLIIILIVASLASFYLKGDEIKDDAIQTVKDMHSLNSKNVILSGDKQSVVDEMAKAVGIDEAYGDLLPKGKLRKYNS